MYLSIEVLSISPTGLDFQSLHFLLYDRFAFKKTINISIDFIKAETKQSLEIIAISNNIEVAFNFLSR